MRKPKIKISVVKEESGYSAHGIIQNDFVATQGENFEELRRNILDAVNLAFDERGVKYSIKEISFELDLASFFEFYKVINAKALSERIGMNQSLLAQYISGIKKPSPSQTKRILNGVKQVGRELAAIQFIF